MKTIEQAAQEYAEKVTVLKGQDRTKRENAFRAGAQFAQQWISVEDELPESGKLILVMLDNDKSQVSSARFNGRDFSIDFGDMAVGKITHWRPIELE